MRKRFASLVLLLVLAGGALAGVPLPFGESECGIDGMVDMDCCKTALMQTDTPEVDAAKLCCALNCAQNGTTAPPSSVRLSPSSQPVAAVHPASAQALLASLFPRRSIDQLHGPPRGSQPAYIRHLALLI